MVRFVGCARQSMQAALHTYLSIAGLALDIAGAAFLAYDVLYGPEDRFQTVGRHNRLAVETRSRERRQAQLRALLRAPNAPEKKLRSLQARIRALTETCDKTRAELQHFQHHDLRARRIAVV